MQLCEAWHDNNPSKPVQPVGVGNTAGIWSNPLGKPMDQGVELQTRSQKSASDKIDKLREKLISRITAITDQHSKDIEASGKKTQQEMEKVKNMLIQSNSTHPTNKNVANSFVRFLDYIKDKLIPSFDQHTKNYFKNGIDQVAAGINNLKFNLDSASPAPTKDAPKYTPKPTQMPAQMPTNRPGASRQAEKNWS